jgi:hypothetical protein
VVVNFVVLDYSTVHYNPGSRVNLGSADQCVEVSELLELQIDFEARQVEEVDSQEEVADNNSAAHKVAFESRENLAGNI